MTFPVVEDFNTSNSSIATSHIVDLPTTIYSGELLVVFFGYPTGFILNATTFPVGWTEILDVGFGFGTAHLSVAYKIADGTDGTSITVITSGAAPASHISFTISNHNSSTNAPEISTSAVGSSTTPNPDSLTASWGTDDNLFIALESNLTSTTTAYPTNFNDNQHTKNYSFSNIGVCTRNWNTNDTQDPGTFTISSTGAWRAATMVVQGGTEGSSSSSSRSSSSSSRSSSSSSSATPGTVVWGHHTAVDETYDLDFTGNTTGWTILGTPGTDGEAIDATSCNQIITFDPHYLGTMTAVIKVDKYMTGYGPAPVIEYRTAATKVALLAASWNVYNGVSFPSLGWIQIRFIHV